ncbi:MAG: MBL fold metallo-hydrolase [Desulfurococcales archaeon]|nr:MBL fold metallo-hydrolase [Desulfurococcales archaeon]
MPCTRAEVVILIDDYAGYNVRGLLGQHGLSVLVKVLEEPGGCYAVLFDVGQDSATLLHNSKLLGIDLGGVNVIALSHRHYDHTGGIVGVLRSIGRRVPLVAHPDVLNPAVIISESRVDLDAGLPCSASELRELSNLVLIKTPMRLAPSIWWLGEVPRATSYEKEPEWSYTVDSEGRLVKDPMKDDTGIAVVIEGYGTVVIAGCSHSGIVNIVDYASKVTGEAPKAVIGGLHLVDASDDVIEKTAADLQKMGVEEVHVGHCTGLKAEAVLASKYGDKFRKIFSGYKIVFKSK